MLKTLERTYLSVFRRYPSLVPLVMLAACGELVYAVVNYYALPLYLTRPESQGGLGLGTAEGLPFFFSLIFTFLLAEMACKYPYGHLSDHYGRKPFIMIGALVSSVTAIVLVLLPARWPFAFYSLRALDGAAAAAIWPPLFGAVADATEPKWRATALGILNTVYISGLAIGPAVGGVLVQVFNSLKAPFFMCAGLLLAVAAIAWFRLPETLQRDQTAEHPARPAPRLPYATVAGGLLLGGGVSFALSLFTVQHYIRFSAVWAVVGGAGLAALATAAYVWIQSRICTPTLEGEDGAPACLSPKAVIACVGVGPAAGGILGWLTADHHLRVPALICAGVAGLLLLSHSRLRQMAGRAAAAPDLALPAADPAPSTASSRPRPKVPLAVMVTISGGQMFAAMQVSCVLTLYASTVLGLTPAAAGAMFLWPGLCVAVLGGPLGRLADRTGRAMAVRIALIVAAVAIALAPNVPGLPALARTPALIGVMAAVMTSFLFGFSSWLALVSEHAPEGGGGRTMGAVLAAQSVGAVLGPKVAEWLTHSHLPSRYHGLDLPFYGAAVVLGVLALVSLVWLRDPRAARPQTPPLAPAEQVAT